MIRIERGDEVDGSSSNAGRRHGVWYYFTPEHPSVQGYSRQPLLDACRQIEAIIGTIAPRRPGYSERDRMSQISVAQQLPVQR
jgi:hypothetical protein